MKESMFQKFGRRGCGRLEDWQCTYNVTLRRVRANIVAVEKQWVLQNLSVYL